MTLSNHSNDSIDGNPVKMNRERDLRYAHKTLNFSESEYMSHLLPEGGTHSPPNELIEMIEECKCTKSGPIRDSAI